MLAIARRAEFTLQQPEQWVSPEEGVYNSSSVAAHQVYSMPHPRLPPLRHEASAGDILAAERVYMRREASEAETEQPGSIRTTGFLNSRARSFRRKFALR